MFTQQKKSYRQPRVSFPARFEYKSILCYTVGSLCSEVVNFAKHNDKRSGFCEGRTEKKNVFGKHPKGEVGRSKGFISSLRNLAELVIGMPDGLIRFLTLVGPGSILLYFLVRILILLFDSGI